MAANKSPTNVGLKKKPSQLEANRARSPPTLTKKPSTTMAANKSPTTVGLKKKPSNTNVDINYNSASLKKKPLTLSRNQISPPKAIDMKKSP